MIAMAAGYIGALVLFSIALFFLVLSMLCIFKRDWDDEDIVPFFIFFLTFLIVSLCTWSVTNDSVSTIAQRNKARVDTGLNVISVNNNLEIRCDLNSGKATVYFPYVTKAEKIVAVYTDKNTIIPLTLDNVSDYLPGNCLFLGN